MVRLWGSLNTTVGSGIPSHALTISSSNRSKGTSRLFIKYRLFSSTARVSGCFVTVCCARDFGNKTLITLGFATVETIRKNNNKKNIMSFNDDVATSASNLLLFLSFILQGLK